MVASSSSSALRPKLFVARPTSIGPQDFGLNDRDHLSVDRRPCVPARHLVPPFSIVLTRLFRRQYRHSEYGRFLIQNERTRDLVADRRQTAQILGDGADIGLRQPGICAPWHDWREDAAVRPNSRLNGGRDLVLGPIAKSRDLVGREIRSNEHAQAGNLQAHVGTSQEPGHIRLPEKMTGRVTVGASAELRQVFSNGLLALSPRQPLPTPRSLPRWPMRPRRLATIALQPPNIVAALTNIATPRRIRSHT